MLWFSLIIVGHTNHIKRNIVYNINPKIGLKFLAASFPFWFITIFRYDVGTDYMQYLYGYYYEGIGESREKEIVFQSLIDFSHYINFPFFMITLFGTLVCFNTFYLIYKLSPNIKQSVILFFLSGFFFISLCMMRQAASTSLFFIALIFFLRRNYIIYFTITILCYFLHSTGGVYVLLGIIFILFDKIPCLLKLLKPKFLLLVTILIYVCGNLLRSQLMMLTQSIGIYGGYFGSDQDSQNSSGTFLIFGLTPFISYLLASLNNKGINDMVSGYRIKYIIFVIISWLSMISGILRSLIPNGERIIFLFEPISIISIPFFVKFTNSRFKRKSLYMSYLFFAVCVFWYFYYSRALDMFPYHTIFSTDLNIW